MDIPESVGTRQGFRFVPLEETEAAAELGLETGMLPTPEQVVHLRQKLQADFVVVVTIEDYGKVRWQWLLGGMLIDMTAESLVIGLATAWNPVAILTNFGFELLTSTPVWFGGGYVFDVAFRPVRVQARAYETLQGYPVWQATEAAIYAWGKLKQLPKTERNKKERTVPNPALTSQYLVERPARSHPLTRGQSLLYSVSLNRRVDY
ncbi:hypothetical protein [Candidatus Nitrospira bockiana]